jgi:UDP-N-acetylglucosamine--N-acetylmuramyl-(pentapeptide) pyrophosphoryl-undecaprenol N-acetylglucosamine transferase
VPALLSSLRCQVIHLTGTAKQVEGVEFAYKSRQVVAVVKPFEMHMEMAWAAADQAICRAGALTIAEQMHMQVPAVYIPYPYAADQHQRANAHEAEAMGLGHVLKEEQLPCLLDVLRTLPTKETLQHSLRAWQKERKALIAEVLA